MALYKSAKTTAECSALQHCGSKDNNQLINSEIVSKLYLIWEN